MSSFSASKIDLTYLYEKDRNIDDETSNVDYDFLYMVMDMKMFIGIIDLLGTCPECSSKISFSIDFDA